MSLYLAEQIEFTGQNYLNKDMQYTRHYYAYKCAKDFLLLHDKDMFNFGEVKRMFESKAILNYMNDLIMHMVGIYIEMIGGDKFDEASQMETLR
jgi:hypothetical protein